MDTCCHYLKAFYDSYLNSGDADDKCLLLGDADGHSCTASYSLMLHYCH
jgi:hypothetical protein